jgi:oligopeptide/dipeptide ABC transporter ATP-binding protein
MSALLSVANLAKNYQTRHGVIRAVEDVSFDVSLGEIVALVGESGCGKSTVALTLLRLIDHDGGRVEFEGMDLDTISSEPLRTAYGLRGRELNDRVKQHLGDVGLGAEHMKRFPHEFSGGQRQRIAIARALALEPKLLILDEPTAALDVSVQAQVLNLLRDLQRRRGLSYLVISHNLATVESIADRVLVMYFGKLVETGPVSEVFARPLHPYTRALLDSVPSIDPRHRDRLKPLEGEIPSPLNPPPGCSFAPRCTHANVRCGEIAPSLEHHSEGRQVGCYHPLDQSGA